METIKQITNYPHYEIDIHGNIYSNRFGKRKQLKPILATQAKKQYLQVGLFNEHNRRNSKGQRVPKMLYVHRLVWETFMGEIPPKMTINHKNENKLDCSLENLEMMSLSENISAYHETKTTGLLRHKRDELIKHHKDLGTYQKVADKFNVSVSSVFRIMKNYRRTTSGIEKLDTIQDEYTLMDMRKSYAREKIGLPPTSLTK